jgi:hypothetical protein
MKPMTVRELIRVLMKCPQGMVVGAWGEDGYYEFNGVRVHAGDEAGVELVADARRRLTFIEPEPPPEPAKPRKRRRTWKYLFKSVYRCLVVTLNVKGQVATVRFEDYVFGTNSKLLADALVDSRSTLFTKVKG